MDVVSQDQITRRAALHCNRPASTRWRSEPLPSDGEIRQRLTETV